MDNVKEAIRAKALEIGFDTVGFCSARGRPADAANLEAFLADGRHGAMDWMARRTGQRADPQQLWPEAKSIVVLGVNYGPEGDPLEHLGVKSKGNVSVYARGKDYHDVLKKKLKQLGRWIATEQDCEVKVFSDTAPVMEKPLAARAGLGWQGKHTGLVSKDFGSWLFLGEVFTTLELPPDKAIADQCGSCDRCLRACPTGALDPRDPYRIDATRCISYLTIEYKGNISADLMSNMGNHVFGCDDCLSACPWNKFAKPSPHEALKPRQGHSAPVLSDLTDLDDGAFRKAFAGSPIKRAGRDAMVRNSLIALFSNKTRSSEERQAIRRRMDDSSSVVRAVARWIAGVCAKNPEI